MATKKKSKGKVAKKAAKAPATKGRKNVAVKAPVTSKPAGPKKRIFVTLEVSPDLKAKLQAAADKKAGKAGASLAAYCREILAGTVAAK